MFDRRKFVMGAASLPLSLALPHISVAQNDAPDFEVAGSVETDPPGYEVAWSNDWNPLDETSLANMLLDPIPGNRGFIALGIHRLPDFPVGKSHIVILESVAHSNATDAEAFIANIPDIRPQREGYAKEMRVHSRHVTERGGWVCYGVDQPDPSTASRSIELFYLPQSAGDPLLIVSAVVLDPKIPDYSPDVLSFVDSSISINGDWLMGMDDLDNYWQALEAVSDGP